MGRAVVFVDDHVVGIRVHGQVVVSYPRRVWEPTRVEDGVRYWSSRERTPVELFELTSQLHTKAQRINEHTSRAHLRRREVSERPGRKVLESIA
jgi:hypothetical protein